MERITARWPDGRTVTYWDREVTGDMEIMSALDRYSRITGPSRDGVAGWRRNGISFMTASNAALAPTVPEFETSGISSPI
jgi:hypothetical protein